MEREQQYCGTEKTEPQNFVVIFKTLLFDRNRTQKKEEYL